MAWSWPFSDPEAQKHKQTNVNSESEGPKPQPCPSGAKSGPEAQNPQTPSAENPKIWSLTSNIPTPRPGLLRRIRCRSTGGLAGLRHTGPSQLYRSRVMGYRSLSCPIMPSSRRVASHRVASRRAIFSTSRESLLSRVSSSQSLCSDSAAKQKAHQQPELDRQSPNTAANIAADVRSARDVETTRWPRASEGDARGPRPRGARGIEAGGGHSRGPHLGALPRRPRRKEPSGPATVTELVASQALARPTRDSGANVHHELLLLPLPLMLPPMLMLTLSLL